MTYLDILISYLSLDSPVKSMASPVKPGSSLRPLVAAEDNRGEGSSGNAKPAFKPVMDYTDKGTVPFYDVFNRLCLIDVCSEYESKLIVHLLWMYSRFPSMIAATENLIQIRTCICFRSCPYGSKGMRMLRPGLWLWSVIPCTPIRSRGCATCRLTFSG